MAFPVDLLTNVDLESLEEAAKEYMSRFPYRNPEYLSPHGSKQIEIGLCNVSFVPLYGEDTKKKLLALFSPDDSKTVVGLHLLGQWWGVEDVLKTAEPSRSGLIKVSTLGERIVLYVLNRIVLRKEKSAEDVSFLCHCEHESAKILWKDGEAIGFYSFKPKGSLCRNFLTQCYQLPLMDTMFVRKCHRDKGHGIQILEDFVGSFRKENVGLKFPLSEAMYKLCEKYLRLHPADEELLWEVEKIGSPFQRTLIAKRLQKLKLKEKDQVVSKLNFEEDEGTAPMETEITNIQETPEYTVKTLGETITDVTSEVDDIPVTRRGRGSNLKRRGIRENSEERLNIIRVEHIEAGVESPTEVAIEENLDNIFSVQESEAVLRSTTDTVTATMIEISELRDSQREEEQDIGKDIITVISEGTPVTHVTTAGDILSQRGSEDECDMVKEDTVEIQGAIIGSIEQRQLQSVVDIEIVMMSTGTEEEQHENLENNKDVEKDETVCEAEWEGIKQTLEEPEEENSVSEIAEEVAEQSEIHAELTEEQSHWDVEITEKKERSEDEVMEECGKDLPEENRDDNIGTEKCESKDEYTVVLQSVDIKDQTKMAVHCITGVICTKEALCEKKNEAETEVSESNQTKSNKYTLIEGAEKNKLGSDGAEQIFTQSKLPQKRTSSLTPSRKSKRLRHQPAETYLRTTKTVKTTRQRSKHRTKAMMQEDTKQSIDKPEHDGSEIIEESSVENKAESDVEEYKEHDKLTVETVSSMDDEITQVEETADVVPDVSELVEREEVDQEEAPQQPSVEPTEVQELRTTSEKDEETVENSPITMTPSEAKVVLVDLHKLPPEEAGVNHGEIDIAEHDEINHIVSFRQQVPEETMKIGKQDGTMVTKPMEERACTTATEEYNVAANDNITGEQSAEYKEQEGEPELETTDDVLKSQDEKPNEKTDTEQADEKNSYEACSFLPEQGKQSQKKGLTDKPCEMANSNVDETAAVASGSSELLKATETNDKEKEPQIIEATKEEIPLVEAEPDNVTEKGVEEIRKMEKGETNLTRQTHSETEMSSLTQEKDVPEQEAPVSTERSLRRRTIRVQFPERRKSRHVQKQGGKTDVGHQERNTAETKNKTKTISMTTEERVEELDQDVKKIENKEVNLAELEPVEEPGMSRNDYEKTTTEETVNVCIPIRTTETGLEGLDETAHINYEEIAAVDIRSSEPLMAIEKYDQEKEFQFIRGSEEEDCLVEEEEVEKEDRAPVIKLQKATIVLVDLNQLSQNTEEGGNTPEVFTFSQTEDQLKLDEPNKSQQELCDRSSEEDKQQEELQTQGDPEKEDMTFQEQKPTEDRNKEEGVNSLIQEKMVQEILHKEAPVSRERSLRRRTIKVHSPPRRKSRRIQKQEPEASEDKNGKKFPTEVEGIYKESAKLDDKEETPQKSTANATEKVIQLVEAEPDECAERVVEEINKIDNREINLILSKHTGEETLEMEEESSLEQNENEPLVENDKETAETENPMEMDKDPVVSKEQPYVVEGTTTHTEEEVSQVESTETNQSDHEGITRKRLQLSAKDVTSTQKTRKSTRLHKEQNVLVIEADMSRSEFEENSVTLQETSTLTVETTLESLDEFSNPNAEETPDVESKTSELIMDVEIEDKVEETVFTLLEKAEPQEKVAKNDSTPVIQLQKATVVLVDLNKLCQNTEGESETREVPIHFQTEEILELDKQVRSEHQLCDLTSEEKLQELQIEEDTEKTPEDEGMEEANTAEEQNEADKQHVIFEGPKLTEDLEGQNYVTEAEIVENYRAVISGEHQETATMVENTSIIQEAEKDQDVALKEKQTDRDVERRSLSHEASEAIQEILEGEAPVSIERSLRRRTIKVHSPPRRKSRRVQKQGPEASEDKYGVPITGKEVEEMHVENAKLDDKEETPQKSTVNAAEKVIQLVEAEPVGCREKVVEEINKIENKETNLVVTEHTDEEALEKEKQASLEQQENEPLVENDKETAETENTMEMDKDPVVSKEQPYVVEGTTTHTEEEVSQVESTETNQSDHEGITRRSLRLSAKEVTSIQKTRKSTRLHKEQNVLVTEADMSKNEYEENTVTLQETSTLTVETTLESCDEFSNPNVEETPDVESKTSELIMDVEIEDKVEQTVFTLLEKAEPQEKAAKNDSTPVIQLQKATVVLVDLNKLCQNTEGESETREVPIHFQTEEILELDKQVRSEHQLCDLTSEEKLQELQIEGDTEKTPEDEGMEEANTAEEQNEADKQHVIFEGPKLTEDLEGQNYVTEAEIVENYRAVISGEHQETATIVENTSIIQEAEEDQDVALKEKQTDRDVERRSLSHEASEAFQEILDEEEPVSIERSLRRRTIKVHSPPRRKSRRVQKQGSEASEDKYGVPITGKEVEEMHVENAKLDDKEETPQKSTVNAAEKVIQLVEAEPDGCREKVVEEINKIENKETNLVVTEHTDEEALEKEKQASLEQQENEPLVENDKETAETEKPMEMDKDPVVSKEQPYVVEGTTTHTEEEVSQVESTETNQSDHEGITRRSLRLSAKEVTSIQKTRKSTRLHKEQNVLVTEADMSKNEHEENTVTLQETPTLTVETTLESRDEFSNPNVEETPDVKPKSSELIMGIETDDKVEEIVEEQDKPTNSDHLCNLTPEKEEKQELQKEKDLEGQNYVRETEIAEEYKMVIATEEHQEATTMADEACIIQESENYQDISFKEKQTDSDVEMCSLPHEAPEDVQDILEEEAPVSTERSLRRRTIKVHSPPRRKLRSVQKQEAEALVDKTGDVPITRKGEHAETKVTLQTSTVEDPEEEIPLLQAEPQKNTESLASNVTPEMGRKEADLEKQENQPLVENEKETAQIEKPMEIDDDPVVSKEQTFVIEEVTAIQLEEKLPQIESYETNENEGEKIIRRGQKIRTQTNTQLYTAELELVKEADMSGNEETSSTVAETVNVCVSIITAEINATENRDIVSMSEVEAASDKQEIDISKALPDRSTEKEEDEPESSIKSTENAILVEMDKTQKGSEEGVEENEEKDEPPQKNRDQEQEENILDKGEDEIRASSVEEDTSQQEETVSQEENVGETNLTNEFKRTAVAFERLDQEEPFITRSLRSRTVTVQSTPTRNSKRLIRQEVESEKETNDNIYGNENDSAIPQPADDFNIPIEKETEVLNTEESTAKFENLETKEKEDIIQVNTDRVEETGTTDDTVAKGNYIQFEIMESNSAGLENTNKTHEDNLEKEDVLEEQVEEKVSNVHEEEIEKAADVQRSCSDLEETVERRTLRKRTTVEAAASRKSKRLYKHECDENSKQVGESVMEQTESIEETFTADNVELRSDVPAAVFEGSHLGEKILQEIPASVTDTATDADESQEKQKGVNKTQTHEDNKEENKKLVEGTDEIEEVIDEHIETEEHLESNANESFTLELETEDNYDQQENEADKESRVAMETEKSEEGEENISDDDEKGLAIEKHVVQSSSATASTRRKSMRLKMHEYKQTPKEDESDSEESETPQTAKQRRQRKRKAITDSTPAHRSKRHVRAKIV